MLVHGHLRILTETLSENLPRTVLPFPAEAGVSLTSLRLLHLPRSTLGLAILGLPILGS